MGTSNNDRHHPNSIREAWKRIDELEGAKVDAKVEWPDMAEEASTPLTCMLRDLNLLEADDFKKTWLGTSFDKQAITSGATAVAKIAAPGVGIVGLLGSVGTYIKGFSATGPADWVLLGCATVLLAVTAIAVAIMVKADLTARATASAAQYQARASAADAYLRMLQPMAHKPSGDQGPGSGQSQARPGSGHDPWEY